MNSVLEIKELADIIFRQIHPRTFICLFVSKKWYRAIRNMCFKNKDCPINWWLCKLHRYFYHTMYGSYTNICCFLTLKNLQDSYYCLNINDNSLSLEERQWLLVYIMGRDDETTHLLYLMS